MITRAALTLLAILPGLYTNANAATLWVKEVPIDQTSTGWMVTAVTATAGDFTDASVYLPAHILGIITQPGTGYPQDVSCYNTTGFANCLNGRPPTGTQLCTTPQSAVDVIQHLVGIGVVARKGSVPTQWSYTCYSGNWRGRYLPWNSNVIVAPAPVTCSAANALITIRGRVGERAKSSTTLSLHCDSQASLRLTLSEGGLVRVGEGGEVRLSFQKNGGDVLNVSGTDPLIDIEGELIKSPPTAGTYKGSTVLRLDVL